MTKEKWTEIWKTENRKMNREYIDLNMGPTQNPEKWPLYKSLILGWLESMDEAYNVYNMENKGKN